ncbi:MAG TPA: tetratricopeptide repeat protein [Phycisphaerae bacterium]|jgi:predicted O-linked N-acetylglucosamine transferase (SPINDLY family)|nr:tetratricopeptide repeat protein [Phycisphaerae bacterium]
MAVVSFGHANKITQAREHLARNEMRQAEEIAREILQADPKNGGGLHLIATIAFRTGHGEDAAKWLRMAVAQEPNNADFWNDLTAVYSALGKWDEAAESCQRVVTLVPQFADGFYNYGLCLFQLGLIDEAMACYKRAVALRPSFAEAHSIYLYTLNFHPHYTGDYILDMHKHWNLTQAQMLAPVARPARRERAAGRKLRVGYVSSHFRAHPVGRFFEPLLREHDRSQFEIFLYADMAHGDPLTARLQGLGDAWRVIFGQNDAQVAEQVRQDGIDILVDLNLHSEGNRLMMFARKPAAVQACHLAYCGTTGLGTMDYRLSDPVLDPAGVEGPYTEKTVRVPGCYWCYQPPAEAAAVIPMPRNDVVFGCLNHFAKVSPQALEAWARILGRVPGSRLLMLAPEGRARKRVTSVLGQRGVAAERIEFVSQMPAASYYSTHWRIDVALDPFPFTGRTTTCDALWMGVPVVTLRGNRAVGRSGASILTALGLGEWIAGNVDEYVEIAVKLAGDKAGRQRAGVGMRERMQNSPLMDAKGYAREVEEAYRKMWDGAGN